MSAFDQQTDQYVSQIKQGSNSILVSIRVRPLSTKQKGESKFQSVKVLDGKLLYLQEPDSKQTVDILRKNRSKQVQYSFDYVFEQQVGTKTIFDKNVAILLDGLMKGFNASVLAYGATGCGKTYTMVGDDKNLGLMAMAVMELLNRVSVDKKYMEIKLKASYLQIYNENVKDLLISEGIHKDNLDKNLEIRQDPKEGISIPGLTQVSIDNLTKLKTVLKVGAQNRTMESTSSNDVSSRSHAIFLVQVESCPKAKSLINETLKSKLYMVDLAGSERAAKTQNRGLRMVEGAKINQSLLVLGNCIKALSEASEKGSKGSFVPYRGSKLTRLLKDSLGGNCRTVLIAHISPSFSLFEETYKTLHYAHRSKIIKNNPIRNTILAQTHITNYVNVINNLKRQNEQLKIEMREKELNKKTSESEFNVSLPLVQNTFFQQAVQRYETIINKQFKQEEALLQKTFKLDMKIEMCAFKIYEMQLGKVVQKNIDRKTQEMADFTKQKIALLKKLQDKQTKRESILKQIKANETLGSIGLKQMNGFFKQRKVQYSLKSVSYKEELVGYEKKQMNALISCLSKILKNKDQTIQKQKIAIKKNNIISRVTFTQLKQADQQKESLTLRIKNDEEEKITGRSHAITPRNQSVQNTKRSQKEISQKQGMKEKEVEKEKLIQKQKNLKSKQGLKQKQNDSQKDKHNQSKNQKQKDKQRQKDKEKTILQDKDNQKKLLREVKICSEKQKQNIKSKSRQKQTQILSFQSHKLMAKLEKEIVHQPAAKVIEKEVKVNQLQSIKKVKSGGLNGSSKLNFSKSVDGLIDKDLENKKKKQAKSKAKFFVAPIPR